MPHPRHTAALYPHKPAYIMGDSGEMVTYRQLDQRSNQGAQLFRSLGLQAGDHIALMMENNPRFLEICWAAQRSGLIYTPISTHLKRDETAYILDNCGASLFIGSHELEAVASDVKSVSSGVDHYYMVGGISEGYESWEEALSLQPETEIADQEMGAAMLYSSGTTGQPKGVFVPPTDTDVDAAPGLATTLGQAFGFAEETVYLSPAPLYHAAPLYYNMMNIFQGGTSIVMQGFDPERALALIDEHRVTHSQWVPIMFVRMLKLPDEVRAKYDVSSMQFAIHAAAPCPVEVKEKMIDWWGPVIVEYYAASEGIGATIIDSDAWLTHKGSVGPAFVGELHIVDDEGNELPTGEIGTIYFGGEAATFTYHDEPEKTAGAYNDKGWATTGDVGYVDEDGFLYLTDRKNFMIISGGVNIYPQEIENALISHEKIADVAVFGIPCEEFGEKVQAVVEPMNWADATDETAIEIMEWLRERISNIKLPRALDFHPKLPRMDNGKLYKRHLMEEYKGGARADDKID
ncbi:acyl-CoA synthetase [Halioglobus japonicus]|uniref:Acyl-CoA synthetase n=1 Tax=Halioglobus japonicus TaxID=930805 RepID=A0AAP8SPE8_9GAMM|nr:MULTISPECIES: acyl-CoA synthetase [Halioglobus]AQA19504.1 acyl-CoA synthetase [Halioglobus japonicus]KZX60630.1 acyl-CoA synthetase [Halioglobus sp. HI00S01]PLW87434.1 acyl-CoA synthetase [Halioglobus japonicus]GHD08494.1 acyl-CoA synthetase [Halioglobus japonicus]